MIQKAFPDYEHLLSVTSIYDTYFIALQHLFYWCKII